MRLTLATISRARNALWVASTSGTNVDYNRDQ